MDEASGGCCTHCWQAQLCRCQPALHQYSMRQAAGRVQLRPAGGPPSASQSALPTALVTHPCLFPFPGVPPAAGRPLPPRSPRPRRPPSPPLRAPRRCPPPSPRRRRRWVLPLGAGLAQPSSAQQPALLPQEGSQTRALPCRLRIVLHSCCPPHPGLPPLIFSSPSAPP